MTSRVGFKKYNSMCVDCLSKTNRFLDVIDPILTSVSRYDKRTQLDSAKSIISPFITQGGIRSERQTVVYVSTHFTLTCVSSSFVLLLTIYGSYSDNLYLLGNFM